MASEEGRHHDEEKQRSQGNGHEEVWIETDEGVDA